MSDMIENNGGTSGSENQMQGGQTSNDTTENQNQPQYVTVEQLNRALTGYNKRAEKTIQETLNQALTPFQQLMEKLNGGDSNSETAQPSQSNPTAPVSGQDKEILKLQKSLEELNKKLQMTEQEKEVAAKQAVEEKMKSQVLSALTNLKVEKGEQVYRLIRDNIVVDENGNVRMKVTDPTLGFEEEKDIKSGLTDWLNSEGIHFLPPRNVAGSGATNRQGGMGQKIINPADLMKMKPSELAKVNLKDVFGEDTISAFFNTNQ